MAKLSDHFWKFLMGILIGICLPIVFYFANMPKEIYALNIRVTSLEKNIPVMKTVDSIQTNQIIDIKAHLGKIDVNMVDRQSTLNDIKNELKKLNNNWQILFREYNIEKKK